MAWRPDYITLTELKDVIDVDDAVDDVFLSRIPSAASRAVDRCCGRQFGLVDAPQERYYAVKRTTRFERYGYWARIDDLMSTTGLILPDEVDTDYRLYPLNAQQEGKPWEYILLTGDYSGDDDDLLAMTAPWGWTEVPDAVVMATFLQANRWSSRKDSPFGISGSPDQAGELRLLERVDPDVKVSLRDYRRDWWAA
jgi:hypothetical protein